MQQYSKEAWDIASQYSHILASETRDLAAWIDKAIAAERMRVLYAVREVAGLGVSLKVQEATTPQKQ